MLLQFHFFDTNLLTFLSCFRMQSQVLELNGSIESVNRERKYHQVLQKSSFPFFMPSSLLRKNHQDKVCLMSSCYVNIQQNTAYELTALYAQWRDLCMKNIEIETACADIESRIEGLKSEAGTR